MHDYLSEQSGSSASVQHVVQKQMLNTFSLKYKQFPNFRNKWQSIPNASQSATAGRTLFTCAFMP